MKKNIIVFIVVMMCFGCKANYQIKINKDLSVDEKITGLEDQDFYDRYYNSSKERVVKNVASFYEETIKNNGYKFSTVIDDDLYGGRVLKTYDSIEDYFNNSVAYKQYFASWNITKNDSLVEILLNDKLKPNGTGIDRYYVEEGTVNIKLPFKVIDHNADSVKNNTYSWNIDSNKGNKIFLKFDSSKLANGKENYMLVYVITFTIIIIFVFVLLFVFIKKRKNSERI